MGCARGRHLALTTTHSRPLQRRLYSRKKRVHDKALLLFWYAWVCHLIEASIAVLPGHDGWLSEEHLGREVPGHERQRGLPRRWYIRSLRPRHLPVRSLNPLLCSSDISAACVTSASGNARTVLPGTLLLRHCHPVMTRTQEARKHRTRDHGMMLLLCTGGATG